VVNVLPAPQYEKRQINLDPGTFNRPERREFSHGLTAVLRLQKQLFKTLVIESDFDNICQKINVAETDMFTVSRADGTANGKNI